jgi:hypothetical protein
MNPRDGIDAVDLASGRSLWSTTRASKPVILEGDLLLAQADAPGKGNTLRLVGLDVAKAGQVTFEADVELPEGVGVSIADGLGTSFRVAAWTHGNAIVLSWKFSELYVGGPPPKDTGGLARTVTGAVKIEPKAGQARPLGPDETPAPPAPKAPAKIVAGAPAGQLWNTGTVVATTKRVPANGKSGTALARWNCATGEALPDVALFGAEYTQRYPSADQHHLLASKADRAAALPWHWLIFSIESGSRVAEVHMDSAGAPFYVWRNMLVYESPPEQRVVAGKRIDEPLRLRALDLGSGRELWTWPIRDTAYRGPYPPRRSSR